MSSERTSAVTSCSHGARAAVAAVGKAINEAPTTAAAVTAARARPRRERAEGRFMEAV
ncbi:hypothetical protein [Georgenia sp. AZ-5]|uniref:hypothetical protein n=1 Tax=Georgenia sp. AZ-5 TaxID=3367526 RepID=UPI0037552D47